MLLAAQKRGVLVISRRNADEEWRYYSHHGVTAVAAFVFFPGMYVSRRWWATLVGTKNIMDIDFPAMIHLMLSE